MRFSRELEARAESIPTGIECVERSTQTNKPPSTDLCRNLVGQSFETPEALLAWHRSVEDDPQWQTIPIVIDSEQGEVALFSRLTSGTSGTTIAQSGIFG